MSSNTHLSGNVARVIVKQESGFAVLGVDLTDGEATFVGNLAHVDEGLQIEADGYWASHKQFGKQFKVQSARIFAPVNKEGIERFLKSGAVEGIGPVFAKKIVDRFGDDTLKVIEKQRWRLKNLKGVGPARIKAVVDGVKEYRDRMEVMSFLHGKLGPTRAQRVYDKYGDESRNIIAKDPYRLVTDFQGMGFSIADEVAKDVGVNPDDPLRLNAAVMTTLQKAGQQGHTAMSMEKAKAGLSELLGDESIANQAIREEAPVSWKHETIDGRDVIQLKNLAWGEAHIARRLHELAGAACVVPDIDCSVAIPWVEKRVGLALEEKQREAVDAAITSTVSIITGGPGSGKTTILKVIIEILRAKKQKLLLAAPTGRAAKRMAEATGMDAETIHKMLDFSPQLGRFKKCKDDPLECDALIVDEASMVDVSLARALVDAIPNGVKFIWVGDKEQLPSVGPGNVLGDMIESGVVTVSALTKPYRQAANSPIIMNAHMVNAGEVPDLKNVDTEFEFIETKDAAGTAAAVVEKVSKALPREGFDPIHDVMTLSPIHRTEAGVEALNQVLQKKLNPNARDTLERGGRRFSVGDKVLQLKNSRELMIYNGDTGIVEGIDRQEKELRIRFDGVVVKYPFGDLSSLSLAFCSTVHKAQGSEAECVVIALDKSSTMLMTRKLLYTAITRGKKKVVLVGQKRSIQIAVSEARADQRVTTLRQRLSGQ